MRLALAALLLLAWPACAAVTFDEPGAAAPTPEARPAAPAPRPAPRLRPSPREEGGIPAPLPVPSEPPRGLVADTRARCGVWAPDLQPDESLEWSGPCRNGAANGTGELLRRKGEAVVSLTQGQFRDGRLEGPATIAMSGGTQLEAEFVAGQAKSGLIRFGDASSYRGEIRNNLPNGRGSRTWPRGPDYDGQWVNGIRSGEGRQRDGYGIYSGQWRDDRRNGRGLQIYPSGDRYEGEWRNDRREGRGTMTWSGGVYEGDWRGDRRNGQGTETYSDGTRFIGRFADDLPSGLGVLIAADGTRFEGRITGGCLATERGTYRVLAGPGPC